MRRTGAGARTLVVAMAVAGSVVACGGDEPSALAEAERQLASAPSGDIAVELRAEGGDSAVVGYRFAGRYSFDSRGAYPLLDAESARLRGDEEVVARVQSSGDEVVVSTGGLTRVLPDDEAAPLRLGESSGGFTDVGFAGWMRDGKEREGPAGTTVVVGEVDVADLFSDLTRVAGQVAGAPIQPLDESASEEFDEVVDSSRMRAVLDARRRLRSVHAEVHFGVAGSERLREALGDLAAPRLVVDLRYSPLRGPLTVELP
jgi:hypothetical protein